MCKKKGFRCIHRLCYLFVLLLPVLIKLLDSKVMMQLVGGLEIILEVSG
jgi:hypothetical protein